MTLLAFLFAAVALAITSGSGITYVVARTVAGGRAEGFASCPAARNQVGDLETLKAAIAAAKAAD